MPVKWNHVSAKTHSRASLAASFVNSPKLETAHVATGRATSKPWSARDEQTIVLQRRGRKEAAGMRVPHGEPHGGPHAAAPTGAHAPARATRLCVHETLRWASQGCWLEAEGEEAAEKWKRSVFCAQPVSFTKIHPLLSWRACARSVPILPLKRLRVGRRR